MPLTKKDLTFAAINGGVVGVLAPFIFENLTGKFHISPIVLGLALALLSVIGIAVGHFLSRYVSFIFQLAKFGLIGVANTVVDLGIFNFFIWMTDISAGNAIIGFKIVPVAAAIINSYIWNKFWSFNHKDTAKVKSEFSQFLIVSLVGMLFNVGITTLLVNVVGAPEGFDGKKWANIASVCASFLVLAWNFIGYKFFVFKK